MTAIHPISLFEEVQQQIIRAEDLLYCGNAETVQFCQQLITTLVKVRHRLLAEEHFRDPW